MSENKENCDGKSGYYNNRCKVKNCKRMKNMSLHRFPNSTEIRKLWSDALQVEPSESEDFIVCSNHFVKTDFREGLKKPRLYHSAVPSVNLLPPKKIKQVMESVHDITSAESEDFYDDGIVLDSSVNSEYLEESNLKDSDELIIYIDQDCEEEVITEEDNNCFVDKELASIQFYDKITQTDIKYTDKGTQVDLKYADKNIQTNLAYDECLKPYTLLDTLRSDSDLQSWTGIQRFVTLENIVKCVMRLESAQEQLCKFKTSPTVLVVFIMTKLKTNLTYKQLSCLFSLTPKTLSEYFDKCLPILKAVLEPAIFWPTKEQVYNNLPKCFKPNFEDCFVVMDCTEHPIQRLKSLESRIKSFSHYKGVHTGKINITTVPSGMIANVTRAYGGKASDKYIVLKGRLIEKLSAGNGVMVDKGYDIQKETSAKGIKLYRPPILDKPQHSQDEAIYNTEVATARIHVERVIQRLKIFNVFCAKMKSGFGL